MKAPEVVEAVCRHYGTLATGPMPPEWAAIPEFSLGPGPSLPRIDLFMVRAWSSKPKGHERHAIEVKVDRGDLLSELARPEKRAPFTNAAHRFFFAAPKGLFRPGELPDDCGLLEISDRGCRKVVTGPKRNPGAMRPEAFVEMARRASIAEHALRSDDSAQHARDARTVISLERRLETALSANAREKERTAMVLELIVAAAGSVDCRCGALMRVPLRGVRQFIHADGSDCPTSWMGGVPDYEKLLGRLSVPPEIDAYEP